MQDSPSLPLPEPDGIDTERLWRRVETLSQFTEPDRPWTRRAFSDLHARARAWLQDQMEAAGLDPRLDAAGNLIGRKAGTAPRARPLITGSHSDTVISGGRFDGIIGVLAGIEAAHAMRDKGVALAHPLEVIDFMSEEPSDYGISCVGSRALAGLLEASMLSATDPRGETLAAGLARIGADPSALDRVRREPGSTAAYLELHIEQGPVLEQKDMPIGVVTHIAGARRVAVEFLGSTGHSGTTPMAMRKDALVAASGLVTEAHLLAAERDSPERYVVATVGRILNEPNMANAIPGRVDMVLEVRSDDDGVVDSFPEDALARLRARGLASGVEVRTRELTRSRVTHCDPGIMAVIEDSAAALRYPAMRLPSGAGHDGVYMRSTGPIGMIFVPCLGGRSHCPEEWLAPEQLANGTRVLYRSLLELDRRLA